MTTLCDDVFLVSVFRRVVVSGSSKVASALHREGEPRGAVERRLHAGQSTPAGQAFRCRPPANTGRPRLSVPTAYIGRTSLSTQAVRVVSAGLPDYSRGRIAGTRVQDRQHRQDKPFDVDRLHWQLKPVSGSCESRAFANPHGSLEVVRRAATSVPLEARRSSSPGFITFVTCCVTCSVVSCALHGQWSHAAPALQHGLQDRHIRTRHYDC